MTKRICILVGDDSQVDSLIKLLHGAIRNSNLLGKFDIVNPEKDTGYYWSEE